MAVSNSNSYVELLRGRRESLGTRLSHCYIILFNIKLSVMSLTCVLILVNVAFFLVFFSCSHSQANLFHIDDDNYYHSSIEMVLGQKYLFV